MWNTSAKGLDSIAEREPLSGRELAAFVSAVECRSLSQAAADLNLTQSALTKRIQALERRLGGALLERGRFGVRPTALGLALYPAAKQALAALDNAWRAAAEFRSKPTQTVRLVASLTTGELLAPPLLARFREHAPEAVIQLEVANSRVVLERLHSGSHEIGFFEGVSSLAGLRRLVVAEDELVVAVAASHPWARRRRLAARELTKERYLTRERASGTRAVVDERLAAVGVHLQPAAEIASLQGLKRALLEGGGFTLISDLAIAEEVREGVLAAVRVADVDLHRRLYALARQRPALPPAARAFWRFLEAEVSSRTVSLSPPLRSASPPPAG